MIGSMEGYRALLKPALERAIPESAPHPLYEAMRYALLSGGKRLRPVLTLASYELIRDDPAPALPFALAIEMIHAYSLIHDDLPAMDNDELRRGKPTCHKAFGEAAAILAGDGLLTLAFFTAAQSDSSFSLRAIRELSLRAGCLGMVAGQTLDMTLSVKSAQMKDAATIEERKTADLITAAVKMGLLAAGADENEVAAGEKYGLSFGRAFQIIDDLLDLKGDEKTLGKRAGKDEKQNKPTLLSLLGEKAAYREAERLTNEAVSALDTFKERGMFLKGLALDALLRVK